MPEVIVKYKSKRTLEALHDLAKYFDYSISTPIPKATNKKQKDFNGVTIIPAENTVDTSDLSDVFTGKNINPEQIRNEAWKRGK